MSRIATRQQGDYADLCHRCYQPREAVCAICDQRRPVHTGAWPLGQVCAVCYRQVLRTPASCASCHAVKVLIGRSDAGEQICGPCAGADRDYVCRTCGEAGEQHFEQTCLRCSVTLAAQQLLTAETGAIADSLAGVPAALAQRGSARSTMRWLLRPIPTALLQTLGAEGAITHASLDACPPGQARHHLRSLLVVADVLPQRDEHTERLATWVDEFTVTLPPHHATLIIRYAHWKVLRTVRRRTQRKRTSFGVAGSARERIRAAARFLRHLDHDGQDAAELTQDTLDRWTQGSRTRSSDIAPFISWLNAAGITHGLRVHAAKMADPSEINPEDLHRILIRELLSEHAGTADLPTRVAGLLILLYGARVERIHQLTTADLRTTEGRTYLAIATDHIEIAPVVAEIVDRLRSTAQQSLPARTRTGEASYLFASPRRPHEPIHPTTLGRKLAQAGIRPQVTRNTAMLALASDLPAAVVATQTGLTPQTASRWAQFSQRDSIEYVIARTMPSNPDRPG